MDYVYYTGYTHGHNYGIDKWYLAWAREYPTGGWTVDRLYLPSNIAILTEGSNFWELPWSSCKHDGMPQKEALDMMGEIHRMRIARGYTLVRSGIAVYEDGQLVDGLPYTPGGTDEESSRKDT